MLFASCVDKPCAGEGGGNEALYNVYQGLKEFGVEDAWDMSYTGRGVKVAVIDFTGIDFGAPDLVGTQARLKMRYSQYEDTSSTNTESYKVTRTRKAGSIT